MHSFGRKLFREKMTIISNHYKFIYVHLHKCGGTSIEKSFENIMSWEDLIIGSTEFGEQNQNFYKNKFNLHKHNNALELMNIVGEDIWKKFKSFTTVRDPKTLYQSYYNWAASKIYWASKDDEAMLKDWRIKIKNHDYEPNFLSWGAIQAYLQTDNFSEFVKVSINQSKLPGPLCDRLKNHNNQIIVDRIYKLERMNSAWKFLKRKTKKDIKKKRENKSMKFETFHDDEAKKLINEFHDEDFYLFEYEKF